MEFSTQAIQSQPDSQRAERVSYFVRRYGIPKYRILEAIAARELRAVRPGKRWYLIVIADFLAWRETLVLPALDEAAPSNAEAWADEHEARARAAAGRR